MVTTERSPDGLPETGWAGFEFAGAAGDFAETDAELAGDGPLGESFGEQLDQLPTQGDFLAFPGGEQGEQEIVGIPAPRRAGQGHGQVSQGFFCFKFTGNRHIRIVPILSNRGM
jgi:hypothetical protein